MAWGTACEVLHLAVALRASFSSRSSSASDFASRICVLHKFQGMCVITNGKRALKSTSHMPAKYSPKRDIVNAGAHARYWGENWQRSWGTTPAAGNAVKLLKFFPWKWLPCNFTRRRKYCLWSERSTTIWAKICFSDLFWMLSCLICNHCGKKKHNIHIITRDSTITTAHRS